MAALLLFLLCAAAVLISAQEPNNELSTQYKQGVDLALQQLSLHAGVHHHFRFLRSLQKSEIEGGFGVKYVYLHFHLKPTRCAKGTTDSSPQRCPFRNDRPLMDCAVCYKTVGDEMETNPKPYVHCIQRPRLTEVFSFISVFSLLQRLL
uniref:Retinoic acid receptor responder protein 2 n=1 Tax=Amphiprion ocellaris TaxID=80972 RepID=A0AAQ5XK25_AMPOC